MFVVFEGTDYAGKTTCVEQVYQAALKSGLFDSVIKAHDPGATELATELRSLLVNREGKKKLSQRTQALMFLAAREDTMEELLKDQESKRRLVLMDRWTFSTFIYQVVRPGQDKGPTTALFTAYEQTSPDCMKPDMWFFLDAKDEVLTERAKIRGASSHYDLGFLSYAKYYRQTLDVFPRLVGWPTVFNIDTSALTIEETGNRAAEAILSKVKMDQLFDAFNPENTELPAKVKLTDLRDKPFIIG